jgi:hypothetical protein
MNVSNIYSSESARSHFGSSNLYLLTCYRRAVLTYVLAHYTYSDGAQHYSGTGQVFREFSQSVVRTL